MPPGEITEKDDLLIIAGPINPATNCYRVGDAYAQPMRPWRGSEPLSLRTQPSPAYQDSDLEEIAGRRNDQDIRAPASIHESAGQRPPASDNKNRITGDDYSVVIDSYRA
jgi:hypothetical protein